MKQSAFACTLRTAQIQLAVQVVDSVKRAEAGLGPVDIAISCAGAAYPGLTAALEGMAARVLLSIDLAPKYKNYVLD